MMGEERTIRRVPILSYNEFQRDHLLPNIPVIVGPKLIEEWSCITRWRLPVDAPEQQAPPNATAIPQGNNISPCHSKPNLEYIIDQYGDMIVPTDENGCRSERKLKDVINIWTSNGDLDRTDIDSICNEGESKAGIYAKDWHLALELSRIKIGPKPPFYKTPELFRDDWMNRYYLKETTDDFRFVYLGPAGTSTLLHRDVYMSYSWSTNVVGRKRWWLFPPSITRYIANSRGETIEFYLLDDHEIWGKPEPNEVQGAMQKWPDWEAAKERMYIIDQEEGETIFVPSGWYHQVLNLTFCISINHNWANAHNIRTMYDSMTKDVMRVEESISDVKELLQQRKPDVWEEEWEIAVQDLLRQDAGWGWSTFWEMLRLNVEDCIVGSEARDFNSGQNNHENGNEQQWKQDAPTLSPHFSHSHDQQSPQECQNSLIDRRENSSTFSWRKESSPSRVYVLDQVAYCITNFETSRWTGSNRYISVIERIKGLIRSAESVVR